MLHQWIEGQRPPAKKIDGNPDLHVKEGFGNYFMRVMSAT